MKLKNGYALEWGEQIGRTCGSGGTVEVAVTYHGKVVKRLTTCICGRGCGNKACVVDDWGYHDTDIESFRDDG